MSLRELSRLRHLFLMVKKIDIQREYGFHLSIKQEPAMKAIFKALKALFPC